MSNEDITKLPQWAQNRITTAERRVADLLEEKRQASVGETNVFIRDWRVQKDRSDSGLIGLPRNSDIVFMGEGVEFIVYLTRESKTLEIRSRHGRLLVEQTGATNVATIHTTEKFGPPRIS